MDAEAADWPMDHVGSDVVSPKEPHRTADIVLMMSTSMASRLRPGNGKRADGGLMSYMRGPCYVWRDDSQETVLNLLTGQHAEVII